MQNFFFCFLLLIASIYAEKTETHIVKSLPSKETLFKGHNLHNHPGTVDIFTGAFTEEQVDFFTKGPEPILLARTWKNNSESTGNFGGWGLNNYHKSELTHQVTGIHRLISEPYGAAFTFRHPSKDYIIKAHTENFNNGFINTGLGEISGATTAKSMSAFMHKGVLSVTDSDGTLRIMSQYPDNIYITALEKRPHYRELRYNWQPFKGGMIFSSISSWGASKEFNQIDFTLESANIFVAKSLNREIRYTFDSKNHFSLTHVEGGNGADFIHYTYSADGSRIERRESPEGRYLSILYDNNKKVSSLVGPAGEDGSPAVLSKYLIQENYGRDIHGNKNKKFKGVTSKVWDGAGNLKKYDIDDSNRLRKITTFQGDSEPLASENVVWNRAFDTRKVGDFCCRFIKDEKKQIYAYAKTISYDEQHNPINEYTWGPITGERSGIDSILEKKGVIKGECSIRNTIYSQDSLHLLLEEVLRPNHKILYSYIPGTDLLASKYEVMDCKICRRSFFFYDKDGILITKFYDDGSSKDHFNLTDITERHITRIRVRKDLPGRGQPESVEELYLDNGQEIIKNRTTYIYAQNDLKESETHDGYTLSYIYDKKDRILEETDEKGFKHSYKYDGNNNIIYEKHRPDVYIEKEYDLLNRLVINREIHSDGRIFTQRNIWNLNNQLIKEYDALGRCKEYTYDAFGNITSIFFEGSLIKRAYDVLGHLIEETDADGNTTRKRWNIFHQPLEITYPDSSEEKFFYTLYGSLKKRINKDGSSLNITLDPLERITQEELLSQSGQVLQTRSFTYNALHLIEEKDNAGVITRYYYDAAGRVKEQIKDANGLKAHMYFTYDTFGEVLESRNDYFIEITLRNTLGQVTEERLEDLQGNIQKKKTYGYDAYGRKNLIREYANTRAYSETYTEYDSRNEVILIINPEGCKTRFNFKIIPENDHFILQKSSVDPLGNIFVTTFDAHDRPALEERFNAAGHKRAAKEIFYTKTGAKSRIDEKVYAGSSLLRTYSVTWSYTPLKKVAEEVRGVDSGDERITTFTYNTAGDLISKTLPNGTHIFHSYDAYGRLESTKTNNTLSYHFSYNKQGYLLIAGKTQRCYNNLGHLLFEKLENGLEITYERDLIGRKISMVIPDGPRIQYFYEGYFLKSITHGLHTQIVGNRNWFGQICSMEGPLKITKTYDSLKRVQSIESSSWSQKNMAFDNAGNFLSCHVNDAAGDYDCIYTYDDLYQITYEKSLFERHYQHDSLYNRISVEGYPQKINALNELTEDAHAHYSWDKNGSLLSQNRMLYRYDELERLIEIDGISSYSYDSFNRRLTKTVQGLTTHFIYDGQNEIGSYQDGRLQDLRILGDGLGGEISASWAMTIEGDTYFPVHDNRGNIVSLQDSSGNSVEHYRYSSFGEEESPGLSPWRFSSKRVDIESGFVYFGRRYYSPLMGRWTTADPQGLSDGLNVYAYLRNNPINSFDIYGLFGKETFNRMDRLVTQQLRLFMNSWFMQMASRQLKSAMSALKTASFGLKKMVNALGRGIELLGRHVIPIPYLNRAVESLGSYMSGKEKPTEEYHSQLYHFNADAKKRGVRDIIVNGMNTTFEDALLITKNHAEMTGHYTTLVYNASNGAIFDLCDCVANFFGAPTTPVRLLQDVIKRDVQGVGENGRVNVIAHSQGGLIAHIATKQFPPSINSQIDMFTIGSAKIIQQGSFEKVSNHVSSRDPIPWIVDPISRLAGAYMGIVEIHASTGGFFDHSLDGDTYKQVLKSMAQSLKYQYQSY